MTFESEDFRVTLRLCYVPNSWSMVWAGVGVETGGARGGGFSRAGISTSVMSLTTPGPAAVMALTTM